MGNRFVWVLLFLTGCGGSSGSTPSTEHSGAAGNGGRDGSGGTEFNPSGGFAGAASGAAASGAGNGSAGNGSAGAAALPNDAIILGPYPYSGGYGAGGTDWSFALSLPGEG